MISSKLLMMYFRSSSVKIAPNRCVCFSTEKNGRLEYFSYSLYLEHFQMSATSST